MLKEHKVIFIIIFSILILVPLTSAGFLDWITGLATTGPTNVTITLGNNAPNITYFSTIADITPVEDTTVTVNFTFWAYDADGTSNIDNDTAEANITVLGDGTAEVRSNSSCQPAAIPVVDANTLNFSCMITMWYWDNPGAWNVTATIKDISAVTATNQTHNFTYTTLTSLNVGPQTLTWTSVNPGAFNQTPTNFNTINNTGNDNISTVQVRAIDLTGTQAGYSIAAENFTSSNSTGTNIECDSSQGTYTIPLENNTYVTIPSAELIRGNTTPNDGTGQETIYYCLINVSSGIYSQSYHTGLGGPWYVKIIS